MRAFGHALKALAKIVLRQGDLASAASLLGDALMVLRTLGDRMGVAIATEELGGLALIRNRMAAALALYWSALSIHRSVGTPDKIARTLDGLADAVAAASPLTAARLWGHAQRIREDIGAPIRSPDKPENDRLVAIARETLGARPRSTRRGRRAAL